MEHLREHLKIKCLLAVEEESVDVIKKNLQAYYKDEMVFHVCTHGKDLPQWAKIDPDLVILSRFLPRPKEKEVLGALGNFSSDKDFLSHLPIIFPSAHIILLAGTESEQRRVFLEIAVQCGITDIVTGKLPGDRPYTIFEAINSAKEQIIEAKKEAKEKQLWQFKQKQQLRQNVLSSQDDKLNQGTIARMVSAGNLAVQQMPNQSSILHQWQMAQQEQPIQQFTQPTPQTEAWQSTQPASQAMPQPQSWQAPQPTLQTIPQTPPAPTPEPTPQSPPLNFAELGYYQPSPSEQPSSAVLDQPQVHLSQPPQSGGSFFAPKPQKGVLVVPSANKGGVGKTTAGISLAVVLAKMGVPTVIADYNFGGPNVATFFDIKDVPGIEALFQRNIRVNNVADLLVEVRPNLRILPGPMDKTIPPFKAEQLVAIIQTLQQMFSVVICDTPPEFWTKPWLSPIFTMADYILAVVDQSKFSQDETRNFAPYMLAMGAKPENIRIVLNRFDPKLHNPRTVEKAFCAGFKKDVKPLPRVSVVIPNDWVAHVKKSYSGEVAGVDDEKYSQWTKLANEIISKAGLTTKPAAEEKKKKGFLFGGLFKK